MQLYRRDPSAPGRSALTPCSLEALAQTAKDASANARFVYFFPGVQTCDGSKTTITNRQTAEQSLDYKSSVFYNHLGGNALPKHHVHFYAMTYTPVTRLWAGGQWTARGLGRTFDLLEWSKNKDDYFSEDPKRFTDAAILPALEDAAGNFLPKAAIIRQLSHRTFLCDSYGGAFAEQVKNVLKRAFELGGFSKSDTAEMLQSLVVVAASNVPSRAGHNAMTGVYFEARGDRMRATAQLGMVSSLIQNGRMLLGVFRDSLPYRELEGAEAAEVEAYHKLPYQPGAPDASNLEISQVDRGALIAFSSPDRPRVVIHSQNGVVAREYNDENFHHHSYSYSVAQPGRRQHVDLLKRSLCNAVRRDGPVSAESLLAGRSQAYGRITDPRLNDALTRLVTEQWPAAETDYAAAHHQRILESERAYLGRINESPRAVAADRIVPRKRDAGQAVLGR